MPTDEFYSDANIEKRRKTKLIRELEDEGLPKLFEAAKKGKSWEDLAGTFPEGPSFHFDQIYRSMAERARDRRGKISLDEEREILQKQRAAEDQAESDEWFFQPYDDALTSHVLARHGWEQTKREMRLPGDPAFEKRFRKLQKLNHVSPYSELPDDLDGIFLAGFMSGS